MPLPRFIVTGVLSLLALNGDIRGQGADARVWHSYVHISLGRFLSDSQWEISHPFYQEGGGVIWETITGHVATGTVAGCGVEVAKGHLGARFDFTFLPMDLELDQSRQRIDINAYCPELSLMVYPQAVGTGGWSTFFSLGGGAYFSGEDVMKSGLLVSGKLGLRSFVSERFGVGLALAVKSILHHQVKIAEQIQKDLKTTSALISIDLVYRI